MWRRLVLATVMAGVVGSAEGATRECSRDPLGCDRDPVRIELVCRPGHRLVREEIDGRWRALSPSVVRCAEDADGACIFTWRDCAPGDPACPASFVTVARRSTIVVGDARAVVRFRCVAGAS
jgi:hypothetical protein